ncbi:cytochrome c oxidase subunit II [Pseudotabrizicola formosa]|uniref:cytochrome c oxidase subunit II n=1 Tax=Pseudotabrizicola formosa TaxID=2030009 RepID=UPI001AEFBF77|nr:cytochrome B [Pseudotabrizicola formosa]
MVAGLWWAMLIGSAIITGLVLLLLTLAWRSGPNRTGNERLWIWGLGVGFTMSVLVVLVAYGVWVGERILARADGALRVAAHAQQWGWEFTQPGPDGTAIVTQGVLYVPAGRPFDIEITSSDVIHSFWVPRLGGKMDAVPGRVNLARLQADVPEVLEGLCAEFCGVGHSAMRFSVVVYPEGDFPDLQADVFGPEDSP